MPSSVQFQLAIIVELIKASILITLNPLHPNNNNNNMNNNNINNNNMNDNNNNNMDNKSRISCITDSILTKLLMEGIWDKTTTKTTTSSSSLTTSTTTKQKEQQQQLYLRYYWPNFDLT